MIYTSKCKIDIEKINASKIEKVNFNEVGFGKIFTDHMFRCDFINGKWQTPKILPYQAITLEPSARVFHYGQAVFEGMKAYKDDNDEVWLFRPDENFNRINKSASRLAIPEFPEDYFFEGLKILLNLDKQWIKFGQGNSLYIRPFVIATEASVLATASKTYSFFIICSPVKAYYTEALNVTIAEQYSRSANGGVGYTKAAGNYAAQFYPTQLANKKGFHQVIWTDADTHQFLEEAGTMNVFFRIKDTLITAPNNDRILDGITRKSIIQLAKDHGIDCDVRRIRVSEIINAHKQGQLKEVFGTGTAAVISEIKAFEYANRVYELPKVNMAYAQVLKTQITNIQYNISEDIYGWRYKI